MKIVVYGLGIIGASICASLTRAGYEVYGKNRSREPIEYALEHRMICGEAQDFSHADVVFLALPPRVAMEVLRTADFPKGCIVSDICGVKGPVADAVKEEKRSYRYVGIHPMAGKETTGIRSASATLFDGANLVIARDEDTDGEALALIRSLAKDMGFSRIVECGAARHDRMIALTSQLAHISSSAYVKTPLASECEGFTGGSFQDMTRVAPMDDKVWAELFILNRGALLSELTRLKDRLSDYERALSANDEEGLRELIREGCAFHAAFSHK